MKKIWNSITLFSLIALLSVPVMAQENDLPSITLPDMYGKNVVIQDLAQIEEPVVMSFWATWCLPCIRELNTINDMIDDWRDETGVHFYAVSVDDSKTVARVNAMVNGKGWDYDVLLDTNNDLKRLLNIPTVPHVVLLHKGKIVYRHAGYQPGAEMMLYEKIQEYAN
ncbi:MAG: TlpA disulfide reductase family protein [Weeksellaceae bacterium]|nr:TlpA disulfide reductase family protein [Weeksellaceae bacterium]